MAHAFGNKLHLLLPWLPRLSPKSTETKILTLCYFEGEVKKSKVKLKPGGRGAHLVFEGAVLVGTLCEISNI